MTGNHRLLFVYCAVSIFYLAQSQDLTSCRGRCDHRYNSSYSCQCRKCHVYGNCCSDYVPECDQSSMCAEECRIHLPNLHKCQTCSFTNGGCISSRDIYSFSKELWDLNTFFAKPSDFVANRQGNTTENGETDEADEILLTYVNEDIFQLESFTKLIDLFDNYLPTRGKEENMTRQRKMEENDFLNFFLNTPIGKALEEFLRKHGLAGCGGTIHFKQILRRIWFENISKSKNGSVDSSGFEHVFIGEYKRSQVTGFHSWVRYYLLEKEGKINYRGHLDKPEDNFPLGKHLIQMEWNGHLKRITGLVLGTTPEWEFAIYTLCYLTRSNSRCKIALKDLNGHPYDAVVQSWQWQNAPAVHGLRYVASTYIM